jgi:isocitrate dehydrogenase
MSIGFGNIFISLIDSGESTVDGIANIVDLANGEMLLSQNVEEGDICACAKPRARRFHGGVKLATRAANPV